MHRGKDCCALPSARTKAREARPAYKLGHSIIIVTVTGCTYPHNPGLPHMATAHLYSVIPGL